jgi:hypothetical protein
MPSCCDLSHLIGHSSCTRQAGLVEAVCDPARELHAGLICCQHALLLRRQGRSAQQVGAAGGSSKTAALSVSKHVTAMMQSVSLHMPVQLQLLVAPLERLLHNCIAGSWQCRAATPTGCITAQLL